MGQDRSPPEPSNEDLLTTAQAARLLKFSPRTLERMRREGRGPPYRRHGRNIFYVRGEVKAWSKAQTCDPAAYKPKHDKDGAQQLELPLSPPPLTTAAPMPPRPATKPTPPTQGPA